MERCRLIDSLSATVERTLRPLVAAAFTVIPPWVVLKPLAESETVIDRAPVVLRVTLNVCWPLSAAVNV